MIQYRKSWQNTARIARIIDNMAICSTFMRSVFFTTTTRGDGFIDRSLQIATAYRPRRNVVVCRYFCSMMEAAGDEGGTFPSERGYNPVEE